MSEISGNVGTETFPLIDIVQTSILWFAELLLPNGTSVMLEGANAATDKLEISTSVYSLFTFGEWVYGGNPELIETGQLAIGSKITFTFNINRAIPSKVVTLCVLSIQATSAMDTTHLGLAFNLTLVNPWYFKQISDSRAYKGNTTAIIQQVINEELSDVFSGTNIFNSSDPITANRYRTEMTPSKFFENRIRKNIRGTKEGAVFMFTNDQNEFIVTDYEELKITAAYTAISMSHPQIAPFLDRINDPLLNTYMIFPNSFTFALNSTPERDLWALANPAFIYMQHLQGFVKRTMDAPLLEYMGSNTSNRFTFILKNSVAPYETKTYLNDSFLNYADIYSKTLNDYNRRLIKNQSIVLICNPNPNVQVGRLCDFYLTNADDSKPSLLRQNYVITDVSHVYKGIKSITYVTLGIPAFEYAKEEDVATLWHPPKRKGTAADPGVTRVQ
jgi:hypothetical protein